MLALIRKELVLIICSPVALVFCIGFLLASGFMNWIFPGDFNILDDGYASLNNFFRLVPVLLIVLIPALTMRLFSEAKRNKTLDVFRTRPVSIASLYVSKALAAWFVVLLVLLASIIYVYTIYLLSSPVGNIDIAEMAVSYSGAWILSLLFIVAGLFSSSLTRNQVVAFVLAVCLNFILFYGFDLLASIFTNANWQIFITGLGLSSHYEFIQKGVIQWKDILLFIDYILLFSIAAIFVLSLKSRKDKKRLLVFLATVFIINVIFSFLPDSRVDFTADKRYTLNPYTKNMLEETGDKGEEIKILVYLEGDLNPGFKRLQNAIRDILQDFKRNSNNAIVYEFVNPYHRSSKPEEVYDYMLSQGMQPTILNETDREGKLSRKIIYPYARLISYKDTLQVNLLKNVRGYSAEENLNASMENLEFEFMDAIRLLTKHEEKAIAFIEGHQETPRPYVYDAEELLSKYFFVNRGQIGNEIGILDDFEAVIVSGPLQAFSGAEKFILDQYIMSGGKVLWLVDGVFLSYEELAKNGQSPSIKNEVNLDDMLFNYGVRINPVLIQDMQCTSIYVASGDGQGRDAYTEIPWFYSPLLLPSLDNPVTKDIPLVKAEFASTIDFTSRNPGTERNVLLTSSPRSHITPVPEMIQLDLSYIERSQSYFDQSFLPVAVSLEGKFSSAFENRLIPEEVIMSNSNYKNLSAENVKMIVIACSDIIRNDLEGYAEGTQVIPMGYDRVSGQQYGNREFIVNAVNWLVNDKEWLSLRVKQQQIRLLDRNAIYNGRNFYAILNTVLPVLVVTLVIGIFYLYRKRKYEK